MPSPIQPTDLQGGNPILTSYFVGYPEQQGFVADLIAPAIKVDAFTGVLLVEDYATSRRRERVARATGGSYTRSGPALSNTSYTLKLEGHEVPMDDILDAANPSDVAVDKMHSRRAGMVLALEREVDVATAAVDTAQHYDAGHYTTLSGTDQWDDPGSDPQAAVTDILISIHHDSGILSNLIDCIMPSQVYHKLRLNPQVQDQVKHVQRADPKNITPDLIAGFFGIRKVTVAGGVENTGNEGGTESISEIWGKDVVFYYADPNPVQGTANFMVTPSLFGATVIQISTWRDESCESDVFRAKMCADNGFIASSRSGGVVKAAIS